jgi:hypothetical protein
MSKSPCFFEYALADIQGFTTHGLSDLCADGVRFSRRGNRFVGHAHASGEQEGLTVAQVQDAIQASGLEPERAIRVYVVRKHLAGDASGMETQTRVFSSYAAMQHYTDEYRDDDPSPDENDVLLTMNTCILDAVASHDACHCVELQAQDDALEALEPAVPGPPGSGRVDGRAVQVLAGAAALTIELQDGRRLEVPRSWFGFLRAGDLAQWEGVGLDGTRKRLKWPHTRKRVSIQGLLISA